MVIHDYRSRLLAFQNMNIYKLRNVVQQKEIRIFIEWNQLYNRPL